MLKIKRLHGYDPFYDNAREQLNLTPEEFSEVLKKQIENTKNLGFLQFLKSKYGVDYSIDKMLKRGVKEDLYSSLKQLKEIVEKIEICKDIDINCFTKHFLKTILENCITIKKIDPYVHFFERGGFNGDEREALKKYLKNFKNEEDEKEENNSGYGSFLNKMGSTFRDIKGKMKMGESTDMEEPLLDKRNN